MILSSNYNNNSKVILDLLKILFLIGVGIFCVYWIPGIIGNSIFYGAVLLFFILSKNHVFWAAVLYILLNSPLHLFYYTSEAWIVQLTPTVGIAYRTFISVAFILKILFLKKEMRIHDYIKRFYKVFVIYSIFLVLWGSTYGNDRVSLFLLMQYLFPFLLFFVLPTFFSYNELVQFNKIIFGFTLVHSILALSEVITTGFLLNTLTGGAKEILYTENDGLTRVIGGLFFPLYSISLSFFYLVRKQKEFKKWYLLLIIVLSFLHVLSSATRGWFLASFFIIVFSLFSYSKSLLGFFRVALAAVFVSLILYLVLPNSIINNLNASFNRLSTITSVIEGDETAEGTLHRITERGPIVLSRFNESPVFGFGYSKISTSYFDHHVGNHSLLLIGGIIGFIIVWLTVLRIIAFLLNLDLKYKLKGSFVLGIALTGIMIIHSTNWTMVSFFIQTKAVFLIGLIFNHINVEIDRNRMLHLKNIGVGKDKIKLNNHIS